MSDEHLYHSKTTLLSGIREQLPKAQNCSQKPSEISPKPAAFRFHIRDEPVRFILDLRRVHVKRSVGTVVPAGIGLGTPTLEDTTAVESESWRRK
ncbi:hypothetical protein TNCT_701401 [Trichonephila clavata]|uniref:Uncharacterized protein n=1 Tax=Trichonephila clavata TaxID=2740835 RepID=A0A8X6LVR3_TRICU|nr:hypothetical protein TNCT_701401 [Trichonephila clavata]